MAKKKKPKTKITKEVIYTLRKQGRREADIKNGITPFSTKVHQSDKKYNRQQAKKIED